MSLSATLLSLKKNILRSKSNCEGGIIIANYNAVSSETTIDRRECFQLLRKIIKEIYSIPESALDYLDKFDSNIESEVAVYIRSKSAIQTIIQILKTQGMLKKEEGEEQSFRIQKIFAIENDSETNPSAIVVVDESVKPAWIPKEIKFKSYTSSIVVARYREEITWIPSHWESNVYLYNKGSMDSSLSRFPHFQQLSNVGRESHTYLHHIIEHYDDLTDIIYFTQAYPFDHAPYFIECVNSEIGQFASFTMLGRTNKIFQLDVSKYEEQYSGIQDCFHQTIQRLFGEHFMKSLVYFSPGAIFAVQKQIIRQRSKEFYETALHLLDYSVDPMEGYCFERLWNIIFAESD
jgi:hypothetical protein